jgi:2-oxoglutarate dehydrogenase E2 component (dihydrolipoamide succinyltransferase)
MPIQVLMPQLGESVNEGAITRWLKNKGERVEEFEPLVEINTDKVDSEIPSPAAGVVLEVLIPVGATVTAGTLLAWIGEAGEATDGSKAGSEPGVQPVLEIGVIAPERSQEQPAEAPAPAAVPPVGRDRDLGFISPVVAKIAREQNVNLAQVPGTGQAGRITKRDVLNYLQKQSSESAAAPTYASPPAAPFSPITSDLTSLERQILPMTPVRRLIADHMVLSKHTSPHVTTVMEANLQAVVAHRAANKSLFERDGANLTFTAYFIFAAIVALKAYPIVNSSWSEEGIVLHREINFGMATSLGEGGLIVPVIKNADALSLLGLARAINDLAGRARARQLKPDEVKGGTFTITNHGISGSLFATPIINQPQCGILGVGAIQKRVVVVEAVGSEAIAIRPMVYLSLTFDHRILDGAIADYFLGKVVESLESF